MTEKHPYELKMIPVKDIGVDRRYQRGEVTRTIKKILGEFDYRLVNPVKVIMDDDGHYYAWDGQQTTIALRTLFGEDYLAPCFISYDVPSWVDAAKLFEAANDKTGRKAVSDAELWVSKLNRGEEDHVFMERICNGYGLNLCLGSIGRSNRGNIRALNALDGIYNKYGSKVFAETIGIVAKAWDGDPISLSAPILRGVAIVVDTFMNTREYDRRRLIKKLSEENPRNIIRAGKASSATGNKKYAREIVTIYNRYLKNGRLDESKL